MDATTLLSLIVFLPALASIALLFVKSDQAEFARYYTLGVTIATFGLVCYMIAAPSAATGATGPGAVGFAAGHAGMQNLFVKEWIPSFNINYYMGVDGISFPLVVLTGFISVLAMWTSWSITKEVRTYCILFLILETGMMGVFLALDFFLFFIFWEVMLLPMYFLIGIWGGPRREYAAIKFFLYTMVGGVLMLIAILMLYFASDVRNVGKTFMAEAEKNIDPRVSAELKGALEGAEWKGQLEALVADKVQDTAALEGYLDSEAFDKLLQTLTYERVKKALQAQPATNAELQAAVEALKTVDITIYLQSQEWKSKVKTFAAAQRGKAMGPEIFKSADWTNLVRAYNEHVTELLELAVYYEHQDGHPDFKRLVSAHVLSPAIHTKQFVEEVVGLHYHPHPMHTFNILTLQYIGQKTDQFKTKLLFDQTLEWWAFVLLFVGFVIKVPSVPVHTWLPDAHVEAPTPISMILAGVLLKMGGYGIIRICYPICPEAGYDLAEFCAWVGVISIVYGAFAAMAQKDFKRLVAYSSVSHMGYVVLGMAVWSATAGNDFDYSSWSMGMNGAMYQMIAHGISSAGMFFMVGVIYDRVHHRNLDDFGGLFAVMPRYSALAFGIFFAGLGLPGLCGFIGEVLVVLSVWNFSYLLTIITAFAVILTAGYILWTLQRVYLGPEYKGPHGDHLHEITARETAIVVPLLIGAVVFGVYPKLLLDYMAPSVDQEVRELAEWTREHRPAGSPSTVTQRATVEAPKPAKVEEARAAAAMEVNPNAKTPVKPTDVSRLEPADDHPAGAPQSVAASN